MQLSECNRSHNRDWVAEMTILVGACGSRIFTEAAAVRCRECGHANSRQLPQHFDESVPNEATPDTASHTLDRSTELDGPLFFEHWFEAPQCY